MANRVDGSLNNLVQGVSQQAARDRLPGQCTSQVNCVADPVKGLMRRAPSEFLSALAAATHDANALIHTYDRGDEQYILLLTNGKVQVYDLTGAAITVGGSAQTYLATTDARDDLAVHTLGDYTFISNRQITPAAESTNQLNSKLIRNGVLFHLDRPGGDGQTYKLTVDGTTVTYTTTTTSSTWGVNAIMSGLHSGFSKAGYGKQLLDNTVFIYKTDLDDTVPITASAEAANAGITVAVNAVQSPADLPVRVPHGLVMKISGGSASVDDYFMRSVHNTTDPYTGARSAGLAEGYWMECADPNALNEIDPDTMPHALVRMPDGTFHYGPMDGVDRVDVALNVVPNPKWADRFSGDEETNTSPSFIGEPIRGIASFQGRLLFLAGEALVASTVENVFDFWKKSATTLLPSDRIDITASSDRVALLDYAIQHNRDLVVLSSTAQFIVSGAAAFQPGTAALVETTTFDADLQARPLSTGKNVMFGIDYGNFAGVREFYTDSAYDTDNADPITRQVESYMPGRVRSFAGSTDYSGVVVTTDSSPLLFLYQYLWAEGEKLQAAWSTWSFTDTVVHAFFLRSVLYLVKRDSSNAYYLTRIDMRDVAVAGVGFNVYLDLRVGITGTTTATLPANYPVTGYTDLVAVQGSGCPYPGNRVQITGRTGDVLDLSEDMGGGTVYIGVRYTSAYVPTAPQIKDKEGVTIGTATLSVQQYYITYRDTGAFMAYADTVYGDTYTLEDFEGRVVGATNNVLGTQPVSNGTLPIPFRQRADEAELRLETNSYLPMRIIEIEWRGKYKKRGTRV